MIDIVRVLVASLVLLGVVDFDGGFLDVSFRFDFGNRRLRRRRRERLLFGVALGAVVVRRFIFRIVRSVTRRFVGDRRRAAAVVVERERVERVERVVHRRGSDRGDVRARVVVSSDDGRARDGQRVNVGGIVVICVGGRVSRLGAVGRARGRDARVG